MFYQSMGWWIPILQRYLSLENVFPDIKIFRERFCTLKDEIVDDVMWAYINNLVDKANGM